jgi:hypothetical protein
VACTFLIFLFSRLKQEDSEIEVNMGYIARPYPLPTKDRTLNSNKPLYFMSSLYKVFYYAAMN